MKPKILITRFALPLLFFGCLIQPQRGVAATASVTVGNNFFSPPSVSINVGDRVTWTWSSGSRQHTVTSDDNSTFNNGPAATPHSFTFQFTSAGSFPYYCGLHSIPAVDGGFSMNGTVDVQAAPVNSPPSVTITNPVNNAVFVVGPTNVTIQASALDSDGTIQSVQFFVDGVSAGTDSTNPYSVVSGSLAPGTHTLSAVATDNSGGTATNSISVVVNNLPSVSITLPASGSVYAAGANISVQASAADTDGSIAKIELLVNGISVATNASASLLFTLNNATNNTYVLVARATDNSGGTRDSAAVTVIATTIQMRSLSMAAGQFQFTLSGLVAGKTNVIQGSTNLGSPANWSSLKTNVAVSGTTNFTDTGISGLPLRFYRAFELP